MAARQVKAEKMVWLLSRLALRAQDRKAAQTLADFSSIILIWS